MNYSECKLKYPDLIEVSLIIKVSQDMGNFTQKQEIKK